MQKSSWRKRFALLRNRLYLYPAPKRMPRTSQFWIALALVGVMATAFALFFLVYLARKQDAFMTPAEDVGIMDQVLWSLTHGQFLHQTICNIINDSNCYSVQGVSRFAIHFEPILFPLSLIYMLWPGPKMLMIVQTIVVASGALPAFWLARLRLRSELAGVAVAALYLLYPSLQQAEASYFHAVTLTTALLLFTWYFLYTRRTVALFVCALLTLACKEELPLTIAMLGLWSLVFQQRWRCGLGLVGLAVAWVGLDLVIFRLFSPVGHPLLTSRYTYLGSGPVEIVLNMLMHPVNLIQTHVLEHDHLFYLRLLLSSVNYLALLAPWVLIVAVPSLALNLLSSDPNQYQGLYQYNAEIIPILIFATIESIVVVLWVVRWGYARLAERRSRAACSHFPVWSGLSQVSARCLVLCLILSIMLLGVLRHEQSYGVLPFTQNYMWPQVTAHDERAQRFIHMIPANASVSAQSSLVPHISQRKNIYLYPYGVGVASYVFLDVTSDVYPYISSAYTNAVKNMLLDGDYGILAAGDGYLLLKRGLPAPGLVPAAPMPHGVAAQPNVPTTFCSFIQAPSHPQATRVQVDFRAPGPGNRTISLVGFQIQRPGAFLQITTYWQVNQPDIAPVHIRSSLLNAAGQELFNSENFTGVTWCPTNTWQPGKIIQMSTSLMYIGNVHKGQAHVMLTLLPDSATSVTMESRAQGLPFQIIRGSSPNTVTALSGTNLVQLQTISIS